MGINGLWGVLTPFSEKKSLHEIRGETIAVDLSGWVCDSQNVTDYYVQPKLYLRNLFFRTMYLLLADIKPIFVLEGDAPELKRDVMAARNAIQFRGAAPRTETAAAVSKRPDVGRKRFRNVLKECESLLKSMGVICIKGQGEAEATCAQLNAQGLVDAVVSQDSDCFAYGAHRVYRNFSVSSSAGGGAMQGSVDCYDARKMYEQNGFGRNKMVALAILCGCDYGAGACGSSKVTVLSFLETVSEEEVIDRLLSWVIDPDRYSAQERWLGVPGRCDRCGHAGRSHARLGCPACATSRACLHTGHKTKVAEVKRELALRNRALNCGAPFPEPKVMKEFLNTPAEKISLDNLKTSPPSLVQFMKLMTSKLDWSQRYCVEKFLPLLTKTHLQEHVPCRTLKPVRINKKRTPRGVPSFEIVWEDTDGQYEGLIPDDQFDDDEDHKLPWTTTERQDLVRKFYPKLVEDFEELTKKPVVEKKTRGRKKKEVNENEPDKPKRKYNRKVKKLIDTDMVNLSNSMNRMNVSEKTNDVNTSKANVSVKVNKLKRKIKNTKSKNQKTIDSFIQNKRRKSKKLMESLKYSFRDIMCEADVEFDMINNYENKKYDSDKENSKATINLDDGKDNQIINKPSMSILNLSEDDINESELSDIVDKIVASGTRSKTATVDNNLVKLIFATKTITPRKSGFRKSILSQIHNNCSTPRESPVRRKSVPYQINASSNSEKSRVNTSHFFDKLTNGCDAFELSLNYDKEIATNSDSEQTLDYSLESVHL
ncbi:flap endonuclease GEN [Plutella xylostella]|uniref:flap endonuclease GEN n=1 Tax=Plutella xylostella TaxID=51655 RepID=UPI002032C74C|nr:flap endonuclease GEN [Plutella xylostella]